MEGDLSLSGTLQRVPYFRPSKLDVPMSSRFVSTLLASLVFVACSGSSHERDERHEPAVHEPMVNEPAVNDHDGNDHDGDDHDEGPGEDSPRDPLEDPSYRSSISRAGTYKILWMPLRGESSIEIPRNEHFELLVRVYEKKDSDWVPLEGCRLGVSGWMPDHGHGMNVRPQSTEVGGGAYRVRGMLFHMGGHWQLFVDVIDEGHSERAEYDVLL